MKLFFVLTVLFCHFVTVKPNELKDNSLPTVNFRRKLRGDNKQLNAILRKASIVIPAQSSFKKLKVTERLGPRNGIKVEMTVHVGNQQTLGQCNNLKIVGDLSVKGRLQKVARLNGEDVQRYIVTIAATGVQISCQVPLLVKLDKVLGIPSWFFGQSDKPGTLYASASNISFAYTFNLYSENFAQKLPFFADVKGGCDIDLGNVNYKAKDALVLYSKNTKGINLDDKIEDALRRDSSLIGNPTKEALCNSMEGFASDLSEIMLSNDIIEKFSDITIYDSMEEMVEIIEKTESSLTVEPGVNPFDLSILNPLLEQIANDEKVQSMITQFVGDQNLLDFAVNALNEEFGVKVDADQSYINLVPLLEKLTSAKYQEDNLSVLMQSWPTDYGSFDVSIQVESFTLKVKNKTMLGLYELIEQLTVAGKHTLLAADLDLGNVVVSAEFGVAVNLQSPGFEGFLPEFLLALDEHFSAQATINSIVVAAAALFPIDLGVLLNSLLGPILQSPIDCIFSSFYNSIRFPVVQIQTENIRTKIEGFEDLIAVIFGDIAQNLAFIYQSLLAAVAVNFLHEYLTDSFSSKDSSFDCLQTTGNSQEMYDFSEGIFSTVSGFIDENSIEDIAELILGTDPEFSLVEESKQYSFRLPSIQGWTQKVSFSLNNVKLRGIGPPKMNSISLDVPTASAYYPQGMVGSVDVFSRDHPVVIMIDMALTRGEPTIRENNFAQSSPPSLIAGHNRIKATIQLSSLKASAELFAKISEYGIGSMVLGNFGELDCWTGRLLSPGGWKHLEVAIDGLKLDLDCNCTTATLNELAESISSDKNIKEIERGVQEILLILVNGLKERHSDTKFIETIQNARDKCADSYGHSIKALSVNDGIQNENEHNSKQGVSILVILLTVCFVFKFSARWLPWANNRSLSLSISDPEEKQSSMQSLSRHHLIPFPVRLLVSISLVLNLFMFVYGDTGVALVIGFEAYLVEVPFLVPKFASYSIISSTSELYHTGAIGLALFITLFVITWPFLKLLALAFCWWTPINSRLTLQRRGKILRLLDGLGKWSFIELVFIIVLLFIFNFRIGSPAASFLSNGQLYSLQVFVNPQSSFYVFTAAVIVSILLSNIMVAYQERITFTYEKIDFGISDSDAKQETFHVVQVWPLVHGSKALVPFICIVISCVLWGFGTMSDLLTVDYLGFIALLMRIESGSSSVSFSILSLGQGLFESWSNGDNNGYLFLTGTFLATQFLFPIVIVLTCGAILFPFTFDSARKYQRRLTLLQAWAASEVLLVSVITAVLEIDGIASEFRIRECDALSPIFRDILYPLGIISSADIEATCFGVGMSIEQGSYYLGAASLLVTVLLQIVQFRLANALQKWKTNHKEGQWAKKRDFDSHCQSPEGEESFRSREWVNIS